MWGGWYVVGWFGDFVTNLQEVDGYAYPERESGAERKTIKERMKVPKYGAYVTFAKSLA